MQISHVNKTAEADSAHLRKNTVLRQVAYCIAYKLLIVQYFYLVQLDLRLLIHHADATILLPPLVVGIII